MRNYEVEIIEAPQLEERVIFEVEMPDLLPQTPRRLSKLESILKSVGIKPRQEPTVLAGGQLFINKSGK